ncbi:ABC transporter transmembrane domain-containing protein [Hyphococcus sp.]|uniref:ABC transporter transmembrane domain-containing protein n=1 Tax=Hyphococcus sp. TaxID=2038636 RepID=UPI003CCBED29
MAEPPLSLVTYGASAVVNILALALPLTILQIYDRVLPNASFDTLSALIIVLISVVIIDGLLKYFRSAVVNWSAASFTHTVTVRALSTMLKSRPSSFSRITASEHLERLNAVSGLGGHLGGQSRIVAVDILFIPIFASVIILVGGMIFFVVLSLFALFGYLAMRRTRALNATIAERETHESRKSDFIIEVLRSMQTVKSCGMEPLMMRRFERLQSAGSMITKRIINLTGTAQTYSAMYASLSIVAIVGVGAVLVLNGRLTLGALACCMLLSSQLLQPLMRSLASWNDIQLAKYRRERVTAIFEDNSEKTEFPNEYQHKAIPTKVTLKNLTVQYGDAKPLFENLNLVIPAGAMIAIKGADGSGRSSLLRVLMGDTPVTAGQVIIGDLTGAEHSRNLVRYVGQTPTIFRGTILDNLTLFGSLPAKTALTASRIIGLDEEIVRMPLGYDTMLKSAAGRDVPAPTAQRISIVRALATRPSVLILDEANTLLDLAGEQRFAEALQRLRGKMTIILATHRPSLIRLADKCYEVTPGKLVLLDNENSTARAAS